MRDTLVMFSYGLFAIAGWEFVKWLERRGK